LPLSSIVFRWFVFGRCILPFTPCGSVCSPGFFAVFGQAAFLVFLAAAAMARFVASTSHHEFISPDQQFVTSCPGVLLLPRLLIQSFPKHVAAKRRPIT